MEYRRSNPDVASWQNIFWLPKQLHALLACFIIALPSVLFFGVESPRNTLFLSIYQSMVEISACVLVARAARKKALKHKPGIFSLCVFMVSFCLAELCFNLSLVAGTILAYQTKYFGSFFYTSAFIALGCTLVKHMGKKHEPLFFYAVAAGLAVTHFALQKRFILNHLQDNYWAFLPAFMPINSYVYSGATAIVTSLAALYSLRSHDPRDDYFLQSILALLAFDFAQRYQIVMYGFRSITVAQCLWATASGAILVSLTASYRARRGILGEGCSQAPWLSVRVVLGAFIFLGNTLLFGAALTFELFHIHNATQVSTMLAIFFAIWWLANASARCISRELEGVAATMPAPILSQDALHEDDFVLNPVQRKTCFLPPYGIVRHFTGVYWPRRGSQNEQEKWAWSLVGQAEI